MIIAFFLYANSIRNPFHLGFSYCVLFIPILSDLPFSLEVIAGFSHVLGLCFSCILLMWLLSLPGQSEECRVCWAVAFTPLSNLQNSFPFTTFHNKRLTLFITCAVTMLDPTKEDTFQRGTAQHTMAPIRPRTPRATHTI